MEYLEFKQRLKTERFSERVYYTNIIKHYEAILDDVSIHKQTEVAKRLGISQGKLSSILTILKHLPEVSSGDCIKK